MEKKNEVMKKSSTFFVLFISISMMIIAFTFESSNKNEKVLQPKEVFTSKETSNKIVLPDSYETEVVMIGGRDTVKVVVIGRKPFIGEVIVIADSIDGWGYLAR